MSAFKLVKLVFSDWPFQSGTSSDVGLPEAFYRIRTLDLGEGATP